MVNSEWPIPKLVAKAQAIKRWRKERFAVTNAWVLKSNPSAHKKPSQNEPFDPEKYEIREGAWNHEHCMLCMTTISLLPEHQSEGYTDGREWLCVACYDKYVAPGQGSV